jgi:4-hydroxy-tetrahydrodipicolinate synthase
MPTMTNFHGLIPAMAVPFRADFSIDEQELTSFARWLAVQPGVVGMMTNGHTGEVFSLTPRERAEVTRIAARAVEGSCPVISSVVCEGIKDAVEQAGWAKDAGAQALDIMPPHHWLRFGFRTSHVLDYFEAVGQASGLPLIVHVYPAWTKASFSSELLAELAKLPFVRAFKIGTREMNKYKRDLQMIRAVAPEKALLTCHDEYLLASMVQGIDGALVGFASVIPSLIHDLLQAVNAGDLTRAMAIQARIDPLKDAVYGGGEPTGEAHANMKAAMVAAGIFKNGTMRPPTVAPSRAELQQIETAVAAAGLKPAVAAE